MDKRRFKRIAFSADAKIQFDEQSWETEILDMCLKGALVKKPSLWRESKRPIGVLCIHLGDYEEQIIMSVHIAHQNANEIGLTWDAIDLDSITHLHRLLELNSADPALLNREFESLLAS